ncbi:basic salivary proline-rich protein 1-like [Bos indicus x Bos taurus]|uniref:basic salivary proline-rich protein 1-like n=1 Tax=Bos indicus x Bos taurus TaxID=30522 RepID=UPI000F7D2CA9|nr:basic salivary proline-rich protein 1-like [Bos indicus x Bos taurus]
MGPPPQRQHKGDASSEPMEGEGSGTRHPQGLGKGSYGGVEWPGAQVHALPTGPGQALPQAATSTCQSAGAQCSSESFPGSRLAPPSRGPPSWVLLRLAQREQGWARSRQSFPSRGEVWSQLSGSKPPTTHPGPPRPGGIAAPGPSTPGTRRPGPTARPRAPHSPPGRAPRDERAEAGAGRSGFGICARGGLPPPLFAPHTPLRHPPEVGLAEPQLLPGDRGAENCARRPPRPPRRCHRREQRRQSRVGRARLRSFPPPLPPGRPPPARRPGQAGSSRESRARGPEPPGTPHSSPPGSALAEGGGLDPSLARGADVQYLVPVVILLQLSLPELRGAWFLPTGPTPGTLKRPSSPSGPHLWLCGKSSGFGVGPGFAPSLSQET